MKQSTARKRLSLSLIFFGGALFLGGPKAFALTEGDYTYDVSDGKAVITGFVPSYAGSLTIPGTLGGFPVTAIGYGAFADQPGLISAVIPEGVTSIAGAAFSGCASLTSVVIPDGVTRISDNMFTGCASLKSVRVPARVTYIGVCAFAGCVELSRVALPRHLATIEEGAFMGCAGLSGRMIIPADVTFIGYNAFMGCTNLMAVNVMGPNACYRSVKGVLYDAGLTTLIQCPAGKRGGCEIPAGVTTVMDYAFAGCAVLTRVTIPEGVVTIGFGAFSDCTGLTSISIPSSVNRIDCCAFWGCSGLSGVTLAEGVYGIEALAFRNCTGLTHMIIPASVSGIGGWAFGGCTGLTGLYFRGTPPGTISDIWVDDSGAATPPSCYYLADAAGWGAGFSGCPAAVWTTTAVFDGRGGTASFATRTYNVGAAYGELPVAERPGYIFAGWWTKPNGLRERVTVATPVPCLDTDHTLYATWRPSPLRAQPKR